MILNWILSIQLLAFLLLNASSANGELNKIVDVTKTKVWGPGLNSDFVVPVRYFFIQTVGSDGENITESLGNKAFDVKLFHARDNVRVYMQVMDLKEGLYVVRYRLYQTNTDLLINVLYDGQHVAQSPYKLTGQIYQEKCTCPEPDIDQWFQTMECPVTYPQIQTDLDIFHNVDLEESAKATISRFNNKGSHSLCHYKIINNQIYRKTYGQHVGFKMFSDAILLSITRKVRLPDIELFVNLGDWPLEKRGAKESPVPIFSWCGSEESRDIIMPTYDITEATLEMMGRQSLDILSVLGKGETAWENKTDLGFWRGRDSRQERLDLVVMSRTYPEDIDAKMTRMFFFPKDEEKYGELVQHISFHDFFKYKYQLNIDGTVAAYRFPYLLAGDAVVFKQDSNYYEHFYKELTPYVHYMPLKHDLSDLREKIKWARENDDKVKQIGRNGRQFAIDRLLPQHIYCYHIKLFNEYAKRLKSPPTLPEDDTWELLQQPDGRDGACDCKKEQPKVDNTTTDDQKQNDKNEKEEL